MKETDIGPGLGRLMSVPPIGISAVAISAMAHPASVPPDPGASVLAIQAGAMGREFLEQPYPGEPEGMNPVLRPSLWAMRVASDSALQESMLSRARWMDSTRLIRLIVSLTICFLAIAVSRLLPVTMREVVGFVGFTLAMLSFPMTAMSGFSSRMLWLRRLPEEAAKMAWPARLSAVLLECAGKGMAFSPEVEALVSLLREHPITCWSGLSAGAQAGMAGLAARLEGEVARAVPGSVLTFGGDASELVHHACDTAVPGGLEAILARRAAPPIVKV